MTATPLTSLVPLIHVADVERSIEFYRRLTFEVRHKVEHEGKVNWAWLASGGAHIMLGTASDPVDAGDRAALLLYVYTTDVAGRRAELEAAGVQVGPIETPFWAPRGEFRVVDPDGYVLMFTHDG